MTRSDTVLRTPSDSDWLGELGLTPIAPGAFPGVSSLDDYRVGLPYITRTQFESGVRPYRLRTTYLLWRGGRLLYVGQTSDLAKRLFGHRDKDWGRATWIPTESVAHALWLEKRLIDLLRPEMNVDNSRIADESFTEYPAVASVALSQEYADGLSRMAAEAGTTVPQLLRQLIAVQLAGGLPPGLPEMFSRSEAASILGVSQRTVIRWQDSGRIPPGDVITINGRYYIKRAVVELLLGNTEH